MNPPVFVQINNTQININKITLVHKDEFTKCISIWSGKQTLVKSCPDYTNYVEVLNFYNNTSLNRIIM